MGDQVIKGTVFINTLKRLARKFGKHTGFCSAVDISVWYYPDMKTKKDSERFYVRARLWDSSTITHFEPIGSQEDLRNMAKLIDQLIAANEERKKVAGLADEVIDDEKKENGN